MEFRSYSHISQLIHKPHPAYALSLARYIYVNLGSTDGRLTGCLASHTSGDNMCLLWIRMIDERTRWATFSADLRLLTASLGRSQGRPLHRPRARLTARAPAVWHHTRRVVPYAAHTAGRSTSGRDGRPPLRIYRCSKHHSPTISPTFMLCPSSCPRSQKEIATHLHLLR